MYRIALLVAGSILIETAVLCGLAVQPKNDRSIYGLFAARFIAHASTYLRLCDDVHDEKAAADAGCCLNGHDSCPLCAYRVVPYFQMCIIRAA